MTKNVTFESVLNIQKVAKMVSEIWYNVIYLHCKEEEKGEAVSECFVNLLVHPGWISRIYYT